MLMAISIYGNNQLYPIAHAIVDGKTNLKCAIEEPIHLVFVYVWIEHVGNVIRVLFPTTFYALCTWHIE